MPTVRVRGSLSSPGRGRPGETEYGRWFPGGLLPLKSGHRSSPYKTLYVLGTPGHPSTDVGGVFSSAGESLR